MDKIVESEIRQIAWGASDHVPLVLVLKDVDMGSTTAKKSEDDNDDDRSDSDKNASDSS